MCLYRTLPRFRLKTEDIRYICLSHRWGTPRPLISTKDNLSKFTEEVPWTLMPRTFQDAIHYVNALGIAYIWIDGLCIVQDDLGDWQHEGSQMAEIYKNAYLTMSVTHSNNSATRLIQPTPSSMGPYTCEIPDTATVFDHDLTSVHVRPWHSHLHIDYSCSAQLPLNHRGWIFTKSGYCLRA